MNRWLQNTLNTTKLVNVSNVRVQLEEDLTPILQKAKENVDSKWGRIIKSNAKLSDFEIIKTLGQGSFSKVMLVRHLKGNRDFFAMKVMPKRHIVRENNVDHVIMEKRILSCIKYPFIIDYVAHFKNNANLFIVLEYCVGGEMHVHLKRQQKFEEKLCKFYAAQVVLALEYLHFVGIIFRDLKPENIVIDRNGYLKITDFGFAKKIDRKKTKTICGTPEYYAPEILKKMQYSYPVDWYTLGILIYEMTSGRPPYRSSNMVRLFQQILDGQMKMPSHFSPETIDIIQALTKQSTSLRLRTAKVIKAHHYFSTVNWSQIQKKTAKPPFVPEVRGESDTQNFDRQTEEPLEEESEELFQAEFKDF
ncbi:cAMP-dependent protein kinase catalytic subunit gamma-like [Planococcus citri]|uniref:cAMP-dependent protein kinase catalytic subunit gamma-like n=1 Tax=Planococcus citri TaxID=170843 RepID=UPI0031F8F33E